MFRTHFFSLSALFVFTLCSLCLCGFPSSLPAEPVKPFAIAIVDADTGRGVPLVELKTVHNVRYYTDSNGLVAFHEPGLMNQKVFFHVKSHGYEYPKDGFGYRGKSLQITPGGRAELKIKRLNIAQRLYRMTGGGIYRDSELLGHKGPTKQPVLNGQVFGSDSVVNTIYRGKIYWFWGDTNRPAYPLGNFHVPAAASLLPCKGGLDPDAGVDLDYFVNPDGFARPTARFPGKGPTWINGLAAIKDGERERLFANYVRVEGFLKIYERGLAEWDDAQKKFDKVAQFDMKAPLHPGGHPVIRHVKGAPYVFFGNPFPLIRVPALADKLKRLENYEAFTCLAEKTPVDEGHIDRGPDGKVRYGWKKFTAPIGPAEQAKLIKKGLLKKEEGLLHLQDADTGKAVLAHGGSVYWNEYRRRWVMIVLESFGTSPLGEIWYAEADTPLGPWVYARKVVTHDRYSFYNPKQHPMFDKAGGRFIFFEGTYTTLFSGNNEQTPYYDYNQVMYKLDLKDPRLVLPVPVYRIPLPSSPQASNASLGGRPAGLTLFAPRLGANKEHLPSIAFFALDRPRPQSVAVYEDKSAPGRLTLKSRDQDRPLFYALPPDLAKPPAPTRPLFEFVRQKNKQRMYAVEGTDVGAEYVRSERPLCLVWLNPAQNVRIPVESAGTGLLK